jgi:anti-anti-sigma factor
MTTYLFEPAVEGAEARDVLEITLRFEGPVTVCVLDGPLCAYTAPVLDGWLGQLRANGRHRVVVDASGLDSLSSAGVEVIAAHAARLRVAGGHLQVRRPSPVARRVLDLCEVGHLVEGPPER